MNAYQLFNTFPVEFGVRRVVVSSYEELMRMVRMYDGVKDVYISLYSGLVIDKVFFDVDAKNLADAFKDAVELISRIEKCNYPYIPIFSGRKGFHIYIPIKKWRAPNAETAKAVLREFQISITKGLKHVDRTSFGDIRRLTRYPNTLNRNCYCVPLPYDFVNWNVEEIVEYAKEKHEIEYSISILPTIDAIADDVDIPQVYKSGFEFNIKMWELPASFRIAYNLLRPCVAKALAEDNDPPHMLRVNLVSELACLGWSEEQIYKVISDLRWKDFDPKKTRYYIKHIIKNKYLPLSCSRLREFVRCEWCGWYYFWNKV